MPPSVLFLSADRLSARPCLQDGNVVWFKMMKHTKMKKLMEAYCECQSLQMDQIRFCFLFDGTRLLDSQTPEELELEDHDVIDVVVLRIPAVAEEVLHGGTQPALAALGADFSITIELKLHSLPANGQIAALVRFSPPDFSQVSIVCGCVARA
jgi:small ubiquitin-related modifier